MPVARALSSQKPGERESCLSLLILSRRVSTSKKPPQDNNAVPHIFQMFLCHSGCEDNIVSCFSFPVSSHPLAKVLPISLQEGKKYVCFRPGGWIWRRHQRNSLFTIPGGYRTILPSVSKMHACNSEGRNVRSVFKRLIV